MSHLIRRSLASTAGFTLIELMIVVATIGTLAAVAVPTFLGYRDRGRVAALIATGTSARGALAALAADDAHSLYPAKLDMALLNFGGSRIPTSGYTLEYAQTGTPAGSSYLLALTHTATGQQVCVTPESTRKSTGKTCLSTVVASTAPATETPSSAKTGNAAAAVGTAAAKTASTKPGATSLTTNSGLGAAETTTARTSAAR